MHHHHDFREALLSQQRLRLELASRRSYASERRSAARPVVDEPVFLRLCRVDDDPALERLAQLEGTQVRPGRYVVAEINGTIVAAQPLDGGAPIADPFRKTGEMLPLLRLRVQQLACPTGRRARRRMLSLRRSIV